VQAGFVDKVAAGIYEFLPLGSRVLAKISQIIREEMNAVDGQEVNLPAMHPIALWEATGRDKTMDDILFRTEGHGNEFVLGPSHEEVVTPFVAKYVQSYKDMPLSVYQVQTKFRNEPRAKSGLLRGREFGMKDMYSFHTSEEDLAEYYERAKEAYFNVFRRCGLDPLIVEADGGAFTDQYSHEFSVVCEAGEDTVLVTDGEEVAQNIEIADAIHSPKNADEDELEIEKVTVDRGLSVKENAEAHEVDDWRILKTVVVKVGSEGGFLGVCIRGDLDLDMEKLEKYLGADVSTASPDELKDLGLVQGFISPVGNDVIDFIGDFSVSSVKNYVTGANEEGVDYVNVNMGPDFRLKELANLADVTVTEIDGKKVTEQKAIEVGNIFRLGTKYSESCGLEFTDENGDLKPVIMGCYGIGTSRLMGTIAEVFNDENGLIWPKTVAPYQIHLLHIGNNVAVIEKAESLYEQLRDQGFEVLYDDRDESAGAKFADADLIGIPVRLLVSSKSLDKDSVEWKARSDDKAKLVALSDLNAELKTFYE